MLEWWFHIAASKHLYKLTFYVFGFFWFFKCKSVYLWTVLKISMDNSATAGCRICFDSTTATAVLTARLAVIKEFLLRHITYALWFLCHSLKMYRNGCMSSILKRCWSCCLCLRGCICFPHPSQLSYDEGELVSEWVGQGEMDVKAGVVYL